MDTGQGGLTQSAAEFILYDALTKRKVHFIPQWEYPGAKGTPIRERRTADAFLPDARMVVLVDGGYWHGDTQQREREDLFYQMGGLEVVRINYLDIENDVESALRQIPGLALALGMLEEPVTKEAYGIGRVRRKGQR